MIAILWFFVFLFSVLGLAYARASLKTATLTLGVLLLICTIASTGLIATIVLWVLFITIFGTLNLTMLRSNWLTKPALGLFRQVLPKLSDTERTALEAGTVWWEGELFSGMPDWRRLEELPPARLSRQEQAFLDGPVQQLIDMCDEWQITHKDADLPPEAWQFIKDNKFWGMIIPERYGGLEFSAYAHSCVLARLGSGPAGATVSSIVAVPNSLGPAELLLHYGTNEQRDHYLPRLVIGEEIPCFGLTSPFAGSDAGAIPDRGIVCYGDWNGEEVLGMGLTWDKRYITLAPVATVLGLAFRLHDPEGLLGGPNELGITCALIPTQTPGCRIGRRHFPSSAPFQNGPTQGEDVFVPLNFIIGGRDMIGQGWRMLMECLSAGRSISLPSGATGDATANARFSSTYAVIRHQFNLSIGHFEGVADRLARIVGNTYACEAVRRFTSNALDLGEKPSVASAIAKYHVTEMAREVAIDTMDIHAGKAVMLGPSNPVARSFQATPVSITVEGANILTRSMMIYGQGAIRCHPYVLAEIEAAGNPDDNAALKAFDDLLYRHIGHDLAAAVRSFVTGISGGLGTATGRTERLAPYFHAMNRYSANLALLSDLAMATLGGSLKFRESLSARLGDVLSNLYIASATTKRFIEDGEPEDDLAVVAWVCQRSFANIETALDGVLRNLPNRTAARFARVLIFPRGRRARQPDDSLHHHLAKLIQTPGAGRDRLTPNCYISTTKTDTGLALFEKAMLATLDTSALNKLVLQARRNGDIDSDHPREQINQAEAGGILSPADASRLRDAFELQAAVIRVDDFDPDELRAAITQKAAQSASALATGGA